MFKKKLVAKNYNFFLNFKFTTLFFKKKQHIIGEDLLLLTSFLMYRGLKLSIFLKITKNFFYIFNNLINNKDSSQVFFKKYVFSNIFMSFVGANINIFNSHFLLDWCVSFLIPIFGLKCESVPKKFRKKLKKKYLYNIKYIPQIKRKRILFRWFSEVIYEQKYRKVENKIFYSFLSIFLNYKNNYLFKKKIFIYKWVLKNKVVTI